MEENETAKMIKELMKEKNIASINELVDISGVSYYQITRLMKSSESISLSELKILGQTLGFKVELKTC